MQDVIKWCLLNGFVKKIISVKLIKKLKNHFNKVIRIKKSPHSIALGFAVGSFIALLPTPGFGYLLAFLITITYPRINKFALFAALLLWNPLLLAPAYMLSYRLGDIIFGDIEVVKYDIVLLDQAYNFTRRLLVGSLLIASLISLISYFIVKYMAKAYRNMKQVES
jgi:uncharacterized protein (DUF2062 family)